MTRPRLRIMLNKFDMGVYRGHSQHRENLNPNRETHSYPLITRCKSHHRLLIVLLMLLQMATPMPSFGSNYSADALRVYAHSRIIIWSEFKCFETIIHKESSWNYKARNGSHYGLGQMRSKYYQSRDPFTQIDLTLKYINKRYVTICNALDFHKRKGYY
jgi:hypothetical protein